MVLALLLFPLKSQALLSSCQVANILWNQGQKQGACKLARQFNCQQISKQCGPPAPPSPPVSHTEEAEESTPPPPPKPPQVPPPSPSTSPKSQVLNMGNLIKARLPKGNLPPSAHPIPAAGKPGITLQGRLKVMVKNFDDLKVCDKSGRCQKVCYEDGTNCMGQEKKGGCNSHTTCTELCARRSTKLCRFKKCHPPLKEEELNSLTVLKELCSPSSTRCQTDRRRWHYTKHTGSPSSVGGHSHDMWTGGFTTCMRTQITNKKCQEPECQKCTDCINKIKPGRKHKRIWRKAGGKAALYACDPVCANVWQKVIPPDYPEG